jgi:hypothetical protein
MLKLDFTYLWLKPYFVIPNSYKRVGKLPDLLTTRPGCLVYPFAVDDMKRLQGWSDVMITHFHELAIYGEQILLSIRYGDWIDIND